MLCVDVGVLAQHLCFTEDFNSQLRQVLDSHMMTSQDHADIALLLNDTKTTLQKRWHGIKLFFFGSLVIGLDMKGSDVDCYVQIPNYNTSMDFITMEETYQLFKLQPDLYSQLIIRYDYRIFSFYHIPTQRPCDIDFSSPTALVEDKLYRYFFHLDNRFLFLGRITKIWAKIHQLSCHGRWTLHSYAWYVLIVFYLQQTQFVPSVYELSKAANGIGYWGVGFNELPYRSSNSESMYQILGGFFKYYSEFDFSKYVVSPFVGRPILRSAFLNIDNVPEEFVLFKRHVTMDNAKYLNIKTDLCIQDTFQHNHNVVSLVERDEATKVVTYFKRAAKLYDELPCDRFLTGLLDRSQYGKDGPVEQKYIDDKYL